MNVGWNKTSALVLGMLIGALFMGGSILIIGNELGNEATDKLTEKKLPLYWVAPMDPNFKRDKPGKSPMGMELIPVYGGDSDSARTGTGTISISPEVINNLGVRTARVERRALQSEIRTVGYVRYDEDKLVHIHPRVEGWIEKLYVKAVGDPVKKGQALYEIYSPALVNAQEELLLAVERKNRVLIKASEERLAALQISTEAITRLKKARRVSQLTTFYAPQEGVVDNLNIRQGFYVKPGTTLMSIGALEQVWVEAEIFERQVPFIKTGMAVTMTLDYLPGYDWKGKVDYINPTLDIKTRTVKVRLRFENINNRLKPNMFAQVIIHAQSDDLTMVVPKEAVIRTGNQDRVVLALENGRFKSVAVEIGLQDSTHIEILDGVNVGEKIVTSAQFLLDSESSKTSDFKRIQNSDSSFTDNQGRDQGHNNQSSLRQSAQVEGVVNSINIIDRAVNITRGPIVKWGRPAATVNFLVDDSIDMKLMSANRPIQFTFEIIEQEFMIISLDQSVSQQVNHEE